MSKYIDIRGAISTDSLLAPSGTLAVNSSSIVNINNTTASLSSTSGSLVVNGGLGLRKELRVGGNVVFGNDGVINGSTGGYQFPATSGSSGQVLTMSSTNGLLEFAAPSVSGATDITDTTVADCTTGGALAGALTVAGGIAVGKNLAICGTVPSTTPGTGTVVVETGGVGVGGALNVGGAAGLGSTLNVTGASTVGGILTVSDTTASTGTSDGAIVVAGGVGIGGALNVGGNAVISGDLTVSGTTTSVNSTVTSVLDPLVKYANNNTSGNTLDIGFYGLYNDGANRYTGFFRDANDGNKFKIFTGTSVEPTTTVDTAGAGYTAADLLVGGFESTSIADTGSAVTIAATSPLTVDNATSSALTVAGGASVGGSFQRPVDSFDFGDHPVTLGNHYLANVDTTGGNVTVNLPAASSVPGVSYVIVHAVTGNDVFVEGTGLTTVTLTNINDRVMVVSNGVNWLTM